jgi:hypothetical protein
MKGMRSQHIRYAHRHQAVKDIAIESDQLAGNADVVAWRIKDIMVTAIKENPAPKNFCASPSLAPDCLYYLLQPHNWLEWVLPWMDVHCQVALTSPVILGGSCEPHCFINKIKASSVAAEEDAQHPSV